jgi:hypothetical protein
MQWACRSAPTGKLVSDPISRPDHISGPRLGVGQVNDDRVAFSSCDEMLHCGQRADRDLRCLQFRRANRGRLGAAQEDLPIFGPLVHLMPLGQHRDGLAPELAREGVVQLAIPAPVDLKEIPLTASVYMLKRHELSVPELLAPRLPRRRFPPLWQFFLDLRENGRGADIECAANPQQTVDRQRSLSVLDLADVGPIHVGTERSILLSHSRCPPGVAQRASHDGSRAVVGPVVPRHDGKLLTGSGRVCRLVPTSGLTGDFAATDGVAALISSRGIRAATVESRGIRAPSFCPRHFDA